MSPRNLHSQHTITDKVTGDNQLPVKSSGIALKTGALYPAAGHAANAAYWFDDASRNWIKRLLYEGTAAMG